MEKFKCYKVLRANECREGCTVQCADCKTEEAEEAPKEQMYSETEAKILVGKVSAELGVYLIKCIMQKNNNPETEKKFEELFDKYKKK